MYIAEIKGKLPSNIRKSEDVLTSNVFSFFKYSERTIYLKSLMDKLNINVSDKDLSEAEFIFWPTYTDGTEPDVILVIGNYYILFEAKYFSDFGKETASTKKQLIREIKGGLIEAKNKNRNFILVAITADYCFRTEKFKDISRFKKYYKWINWQSVTEILLRLTDNVNDLPNKLFALDLLRLLEFKRLRQFRSLKDIVFKKVMHIKDNIFLNPESTMHRGKFIGFQKILEDNPIINKINKNIFYTKKYFDSLPEITNGVSECIFLKRGD